MDDELSLKAYIEARSTELLALRESLLSHERPNTLLQQIPRHMRRKAASYKTRRLPVRLLVQQQGHIEPGIKGTKKKKAKRKSRKRYKCRKAEFARRQRKGCPHWLPTHVWHAKRFHMSTMWGWRLPERRTDKGISLLVKAVKDMFAIADLSYFTCLKIEGSSIAIDKWLRESFPEDHSRIPLNVELSARLFSIEDPSEHTTVHPYRQRFLGPVFLTRYQQNASDNHCVVLMCHHPSMVDGVKTLMSKAGNGINFRSLMRDQITPSLTRFRLFGPLAACALRVVAGGLDAVVGDNPLDGQCMHVKMMDPRRKCMKLADVLNQISSRCDGSVEKKSINTASFITDDNMEECFVNFVKTHEINTAKSTLKAGEELSSVHPDLVKTFPVQLTYRAHLDPHCVGVGSQDGFGRHWDVVMPSCYALPVWLALVQAGGRPAGICELDQLYIEAGALKFPDDYIDCPSYMAYQDTMEKETLDWYFKRPPAKRVNYLKNRISSPFRIQWTRLQQTWFPEQFAVCLPIPITLRIGEPHLLQFAFVPVHLRANGKGRSVPAGSLILTQSEDHEIDKTEMLYNKKLAGTLKRDYFEKIDEDCLKSLHRCEVTGLPVMGFVTRSSFSLTRGCCVGTGWVLEKLLNDNVPRKDCIRSMNGTELIPVRVSRLP